MSTAPQDKVQQIAAATEALRVAVVARDAAWGPAVQMFYKIRKLDDDIVTVPHPSGTAQSYYDLAEEETSLRDAATVRVFLSTAEADGIKRNVAEAAIDTHQSQLIYLQKEIDNAVANVASTDAAYKLSMQQGSSFASALDSARDNLQDARRAKCNYKDITAGLPGYGDLFNYYALKELDEKIAEALEKYTNAGKDMNACHDTQLAKAQECHKASVALTSARTNLTTEQAVNVAILHSQLDLAQSLYNITNAAQQVDITLLNADRGKAKAFTKSGDAALVFESNKRDVDACRVEMLELQATWVTCDATVQTATNVLAALNAS